MYSKDILCSYNLQNDQKKSSSQSTFSGIQTLNIQPKLLSFNGQSDYKPHLGLPYLRSPINYTTNKFLAYQSYDYLLIN